jgi:hypothetical protein
MTSDSSQQFESYVPVYGAIPDQWENSRQFIVEMIRKITDAVNNREIGFYLDEELLSGKSWIAGPSQPQQFRSVFRKVIDTGALPAAGTKNVPHGINITSNFTLVHLYGAATDPVQLFSIPLPFSEQAAPANGNIQLNLDATNVQITVGSNRSNYSRSFVVAEYLLEV